MEAGFTFYLLHFYVVMTGVPQYCFLSLALSFSMIMAVH